MTAKSLTARYASEIMTGRLPAELAWMLPLWGDGSEMRTAFPTRFLCSTARRARETWQLAAVALGAAVPVIFDHDIYGASPAGLIGIIRGAPSAAGTVVVVGHDSAVRVLALVLAGTVTDAVGGSRAAHWRRTSWTA